MSVASLTVMFYRKYCNTFVTINRHLVYKLDLGCSVIELE